MLIKTTRGHVDVLDTYLFPDSLRIQVLTLSNILKIEDQYIRRLNDSLEKVVMVFDLILSSDDKIHSKMTST